MASQMEEILGLGPFKRERDIPGTILFEGREHWYVEDDGKDNFQKQFNNLINAIQPAIPKQGAAITGGCELLLPDGRKFNALSYKGDLEGWREQIKRGAEYLKCKLGRIVEGTFIISESERISLKDCKARFY
jgi:hypothetical protein